MIRAIAIDDEPMPLNILKAYAAQTTELNLLRTFTSTAQAHQWLLENEADLIFMDINMPAISGLDFVKLLKKDYMIIFSTAHSEYAVDGFELNAIDYLLKPYSQERFLKAVDKARELHQLKQLKTAHEIFVKSDYSVVKISTEEIRYIEGYSDYLKIHLQHKPTVITRMTMTGIMEVLPEGFMRIHRSYIIALNKVEQLKGQAVVINGDTLSIGKTYFKSVKPLIMDYLKLS